MFLLIKYRKFEFYHGLIGGLRVS